MPRTSLTREQWADVMQDWWANFPFHTDDRNVRHEAVGRFENQYGPLTERERSKALRNWSPAQKERWGTSKVFLAPTDIGQKKLLSCASSCWTIVTTISCSTRRGSYALQTVNDPEFVEYGRQVRERIERYRAAHAAESDTEE